ncbi:MAG: transcriptional repressor [Clostridia bacterium]|nr:transcriptional repressor [Clostridia bacterium]
MKTSFEDLTNELTKRKIRPSHQRIKVLEYLIKNKCHPTVEQIFNDLQKEIPTLSKSTVYNTLNSFLEAQLIRVIKIEENETRYDIITKNHGHFKCETCGGIIDFAINIDDFIPYELNNFSILDKNVYFKGVCSICLSK